MDAVSLSEGAACRQCPWTAEGYWKTEGLQTAVTHHRRLTGHAVTPRAGVMNGRAHYTRLRQDRAIPRRVALLMALLIARPWRQWGGPLALVLASVLTGGVVAFVSGWMVAR